MKKPNITEAINIVLEEVKKKI